MSRWHRHEWDMLPERAFQPRGPHGQMTLEGGGGGGGGSQVIGYRYSFGIHMGVCRGPVDELVAIRVGDKSAWTGSVTGSGYFPINNYNLFGGDKGEGGIQGEAHAMFGHPAQSSLPQLEAMTGVAQPAFRGMFTFFFDGIISAINPYPKAWKLRVRRIIQGWQADTLPTWALSYAKIVMVPSDAAALGTGYGDTDIHAMNPALIIYECLTNREWGRGFHPSALDTEGTFRQAAQTLYEEGFGMCIKWSRKDSIKSFIQGVLDHIAGTLYTDRTSGLIKLRLIRDDYDRDTLPLFTPESGLLEITGNTVSNSGESVNEIQVKYRHPVTNEMRIVRTDSLGAIRAAGGVNNPSTRDYPGLPTAELALRVAERDLRTVATSLRRYSFTLDRRGYAIYPGQAIRIADPSTLVPDTVVRVGKLDDDFESGRIKVTAVQDVFGLPSESFGGTVGQTWTPPDNKPCLSYHRVVEAPYFMVARNTSAADFAYVDTTSAGMLTMCNEGKPLNGAYDMAVRIGGSTTDDNPPDGSYNCPI